MDRDQMLEALKEVQAGRMAPEAALKLLAQAPYEDIGYAKIDHHRGLRNGTGEVIYGAGKTAEQIVAIASRMVAAGGRNILVTRMDGEKAARVAQAVPLFYDAQARLGVVNRVPQALVGSVVVASGGTSDLPVCEEAALTAETLGSRVTRLYDVGVAGLHRLLSHLDELQSARAVVAVAGMEGALASVVGGLVDCPVIAVPTSVGYGASFGGVSALLSMLNACASGISVVNIDNGFGAGYLANRINRMKGIDEA
ncbi:MAG: nickel pincer cofactor biosynthesis protein LarB [Clostridia bacterium]|nr:nickel pincer cofactor biosynthesis protein LarB [Clostridia bacterium]MBQ9038588.1 nickel pincer cofactor biosynthesis protein LarB [Clostridia bacterium]